MKFKGFVLLVLCFGLVACSKQENGAINIAQSTEIESTEETLSFEEEPTMTDSAIRFDMLESIEAINRSDAEYYFTTDCIYASDGWGIVPKDATQNYLGIMSLYRVENIDYLESFLSSEGSGEGKRKVDTIVSWDGNSTFHLYADDNFKSYNCFVEIDGCSKFLCFLSSSQEEERNLNMIKSVSFRVKEMEELQ